MPRPSKTAKKSAFRFAVLTALINFSELDSRQSASLIYFDVPEGDLDKLNQTEFVGDEWAEFTGLCLTDKQEDATLWKAVVISNLSLAILMHNPHEVVYKSDAPKKFNDNRKQYAFREKAGNLLLKDRSKMGVVLFDVHVPKSDD